MAGFREELQKIIRYIERDPASWKEVSLIYLRLNDGVSPGELESILAEAALKHPDTLMFAGQNHDCILLGTGLQYNPALANLCMYFRISDIAAQWHHAGGVIHAMLAPARVDKTGGIKETDHKSYSVLIVEDEPMTSQIMTLHFKKFGSVIATSNAREAVANYMVHRPDMVFLDIHYQNDNADGFDVLRNLISADSNAFIVMVSGDWSLGKVMQALTLGAQGFVVKPFRAMDVSHYLAKFEQSKG